MKNLYLVFAHNEKGWILVGIYPKKIAELVCNACNSETDGDYEVYPLEQYLDEQNNSLERD